MRQYLQTSGKYGPQVARWERPEFSRGYPVYAVAFFCPICCEIWGRIGITPDDDTQDVTFVSQMVGCLFCSWKDERHPVVGSVIVNSTFFDFIDTELLDYLPEEVLKYEMLRTMSCITDQDIISRAAELTASGAYSTAPSISASASVTSANQLLESLGL